MPQVLERTSSSQALLGAAQIATSLRPALMTKSWPLLAGDMMNEHASALHPPLHEYQMSDPAEADAANR